MIIGDVYSYLGAPERRPHRCRRECVNKLTYSVVTWPHSTSNRTRHISPEVNQEAQLTHR